MNTTSWVNPDEWILAPKPTPKSEDITFYFLRHGYACHNLLNDIKNKEFKINK